MCGIWALISKLALVNDIRFEKTWHNFMKIKNRGPEYSSLDLIDPHILLGFHRLAIQDITVKGNQPFHFVRDDGSCVYCVCNGEIYNHKEIKDKYNIETESNSDCEVIIPLYEKLKDEKNGINKLCNLLGSEFAFILIDKGKETKIIVARDPVEDRFYAIDEISSEKG
jgi:asparagine synthase (glutamine-hydrolysing)